MRPSLQAFAVASAQREERMAMHLLASGVLAGQKAIELGLPVLSVSLRDLGLIVDEAPDPRSTPVSTG